MSPVPADNEEYIVEKRVAPPAHLLTTIKSLSDLLKHKFEILESSKFKAGDYEWKVKISLDGGEHISVKLCMVSSLSAGWEVNAMFNFLIYNHISDKYLCFRGKARRFHAANSEWEFSKLMSKDSFKEPSNGYLSKDKCVFGAEVFVINNKPLIENVSVLQLSTPFKREWKISTFFKLKSIWKSEEFFAGGYKWQIWIDPKEDILACGQYVSMFLCCVDPKVLDHGEKVNVNYLLILRSRSKLNDNKDHSEGGTSWFTSARSAWGYSDFIPIDDMRDPTKGFVVDGSCIFQIQIL